MNLFFIYEIIIDQQILSFITLFYIILAGVDTCEITGSNGYIHSRKLYVIHLMFYFWNSFRFPYNIVERYKKRKERSTTAKHTHFAIINFMLVILDIHQKLIL